MMNHDRTPPTARTTRRSFPHRALLILLLLPLASTLQAQPRRWIDTTLPPMATPHGIGATEFMIGAYKIFYDPPTGRVDDLWNYYRTTGMSTMLISAADFYRTRFDTLVDSPFRPPNGRLIVANAPMVEEASSGREIVFYPFDSSQTRIRGYDECIFTRRSGGSPRFNPAYARRDTAPREIIYDSADAGALVASGLAYKWKPGQIYRYPVIRRDGRWVRLPSDSVVNSSMLTERSRGEHYYIAVTGHLFEGGSAEASEPLLRIDLVYQVGRGENFVDSGGSIRSALDTLSFLYRTLYVTKGDLLPTDSSGDYDLYRELSIPVDMRRSEGGMGGPTHPDATARRFDVQVHYLGGERIALRSIAVRDSIAEMLIGTRAESGAYRDSLISRLRPILVDTNGSFRDQIIALQGMDEAPFEHFAGFRETNRLIRSAFAHDGHTGPGVVTALGYPYLQDLADADMLWHEIYANDGFTLNNDWARENDPRRRFNVPYREVPSIREHNGGRFTIPELFSLDDVERLSRTELRRRIEGYTETLQHLILGRYTPYAQEWPYTNRRAYETGRAAMIARTRGSRFIALPGLVRRLALRADTITMNGRRVEHIDTLASHQQEPSELRALVSLALAYGAKGVLYFVLGDSYDLLEPHRPVADACCQSFPGPTVSDTTADLVDVTLRDHHDFAHGYAGGEYSVTIPSLYVAYRNRTKELRSIDRWLARVGGTLTRLRWRDSYSIAFTEARPGVENQGGRPRPLPSDEIVTRVEASPRWDTTADPLYATYVELGLFDTTPGTIDGNNDPLNDTNHIVVMNRRTFETPYDLPMSATTRAILDSLSESRVVRLTFGLREGTPQPAWLHVREVAPDTSRLPGDDAPRQGLDTIIALDGTAALMLGPGRSALLEITYVVPDERRLGDALGIDGEARIVYYRGRYYALYQDDGSIVLRRSVPVESPDITWEPEEYRIDATTTRRDAIGEAPDSGR